MPPPGWEDEECVLLLDRVAELTKSSNRSFKADISSLKWEDVNVPGKSPEECKETFINLIKKVRRFRYTVELIHDAKEALNDPKEHPDLPPKPKSAYGLYYNKYAKKYLAKGTTFSELSKLLTTKYHNLSEKKKAKYIKKSEEEKEEYKLKLEDFIKRHPDVAVVKPEPPVPCEVYMKSQYRKFRAKHPELSVADVRSRLQEKYSGLSNKKKLKYIHKAEKELDIYKRQCDSYKARHTAANFKPAKVVLTKEEQNILDQSMGKPSAPPPGNLFTYYISLMKETNGDLSAKERRQALSKSYKELNSEECEKLKKDYEQLVHNFANQYTEYYNNLNEEAKVSEKPVEIMLAPFQRILNPQIKGKRTKTDKEENNTGDDNDEEENTAAKSKANKATAKTKKKQNEADKMLIVVTKSPTKKTQAKKKELSSNDEQTSSPKKAAVAKQPTNRKVRKAAENHIDSLSEPLSFKTSLSDEGERKELNSPTKSPTKKKSKVQTQLDEVEHNANNENDIPSSSPKKKKKRKLDIPTDEEVVPKRKRKLSQMSSEEPQEKVVDEDLLLACWSPVKS